MAYNTKTLKLDNQQKPIPQLFNPLIDDYEPLQGRGSAMSVLSGRWYLVGSGATTTTIPMTTQGGLPISLTAAAQQRLVGAVVEILLNNQIVQAIVTAASSAGVLTLDSALPAAPAQGTPFLLMAPDQTSLTGRNVQDIVLVNALAVTDTSTHSSGSINVSALSGRKIVTISNTLNQDTTVSIIARDQRGNGVTMGTVTVAASTGGTITAFVAPEGPISAKSSTGSFTLLASPFLNMEIRVSCSTAPTSGSISVYLEGVSA